MAQSLSRVILRSGRSPSEYSRIISTSMTLLLNCHATALGSAVGPVHYVASDDTHLGHNLHIRPCDLYQHQGSAVPLQEFEVEVTIWQQQPTTQPPRSRRGALSQVRFTTTKALRQGGEVVQERVQVNVLITNAGSGCGHPADTNLPDCVTVAVIPIEWWIGAGWRTFSKVQPSFSAPTGASPL
jgi:hypothetical protein